MKITAFEKVSLINQFKIIEKLYPEDSHIYIPLRVVLEEGFDCGINDIHDWLYSSAKSKKIYEDVLEILEMYTHLISSYDKLTNKTNLNKNKFLFPGFNRNNEVHYLICAKFLISNKEEFKIINNNKVHEDLTSHKVMNTKYFTMLAKWRVFKNKKTALTYEELKSILIS
ncbi:hypothetical protein ASG61_28210 [Bacillus sp. Leaf75]|nr:hypothetical protein ASG61_28210 [Bacillus sp. Leaf75]